MTTDEQIIAAAGEPVAYQHRDGMLSCRLPGGGIAGIDWTFLYTAEAILAAVKPLRDRITELEANAATMKAYYEQVFEDGGKRIAELTKQRDGLLVAVTKIKSDAGNPERVWRLAKEAIAAHKTGGAA